MIVDSSLRRLSGKGAFSYSIVLIHEGNDMLGRLSNGTENYCDSDVIGTFSV